MQENLIYEEYCQPPGNTGSKAREYKYADDRFNFIRGSQYKIKQLLLAYKIQLNFFYMTMPHAKGNKLELTFYFLIFHGHVIVLHTKVCDIAGGP